MWAHAQKAYIQTPTSITVVLECPGCLMYYTQYVCSCMGQEHLNLMKKCFHRFRYYVYYYKYIHSRMFCWFDIKQYNGISLLFSKSKDQIFTVWKCEIPSAHWKFKTKHSIKYQYAFWTHTNFVAYHSRKSNAIQKLLQMITIQWKVINTQHQTLPAAKLLEVIIFNTHMLRYFVVNKSQIFFATHVWGEKHPKGWVKVETVARCLSMMIFVYIVRTIYTIQHWELPNQNWDNEENHFHQLRVPVHWPSYKKERTTCSGTIVTKKPHSS